MNYKIRKILSKNAIWKDYIQKGGMENPTTEIIELKIDNEIFEIVYKKEDDIKEFYINKNKCLFFIIKNDFATLEYISNDKECTKIKHEYKTSKIMFIIMIHLLKKNNVTKIEFQDESVVKNFDLADYYFLKHGETWYDKMFRKYVKKYKIDFSKRSFPIKGDNYQTLKEKHKKIIGDKLKKFEFEYIKKYKDYYLDLLGINTLSSICYYVRILEWK
jgi:hypothetical protein